MNSGWQEDFVELEFSFADEAYPAIRISQQLDCNLDLLDAVRIDDELTAAFFHVEHATPEPAMAEGEASRYGEDATVIGHFDNECILKLVLRQSIFETLSRLQIPLQSLVVSDGTARFIITVPPSHSSEQIISTMKAQHPAVTLVGKRRRKIAAPFLTQTAFQAVVDEQLTARQLDALHFAFEYGYFERPRGSSQAELAAKMDISPSTFGQHLHAALRKLLAVLFSDGLAHGLPPERDD